DGHVTGVQTCALPISVDPLTHEIVSLFHPRLDRWAEHFRLDGPRIAGLTPRGRVTVFPLQLNAPERVRQGLHLQALGRYPVSRRACPLEDLQSQEEPRADHHDSLLDNDSLSCRLGAVGR